MSEPTDYLYFTNDAGNVYAYDKCQIELGYGSDMAPLTGDALEDFLHPVLTAEQITARNESEQIYKTEEAARIIAPILLSLQLGDATEEETKSAKAWQAYYRALQAADITVAAPVWPEKPSS